MKSEHKLFDCCCCTTTICGTAAELDTEKLYCTLHGIKQSCFKLTVGGPKYVANTCIMYR